MEGHPVELRETGDGGLMSFVFSHGPNEAFGPDSPSWSDYLGAYHATAYGLDDDRLLTLRNGHLFWANRFKLREFKRGLFFTADGDSLQITNDGLLWGNRAYSRACPSPPPDTQWPGATWTRCPNPESLGWSSEKLQRARQYADFIDTAAVMVIVRGQVLANWGDTTTKFMAHSMRKSLVSGLYGPFVARGKIDLEKTLGQVGIDDHPDPLTGGERAATIRDLLRSRSGVYHPAALETPDMAIGRPKRGSHPPGSFWWYNNWDFNVAGTAFERETGERIFESFKTHIAAPLQMEDFQAGDGDYIAGTESIHVGYPFRMSARDLARYGLLFLRRGQWNGTQVISESWVQESTAPHSSTGVGGYGYMWWVETDGNGLPGVTLPQGTYWAWGTRGHYLLVIPSWDLVVVHRVNTDESEREVTHTESSAACSN